MRTSATGVILARCGSNEPLEDDRPISALGTGLGATWVWLHLYRDHADVQAWLRGDPGVPNDVAEAMLAESTRPGCDARDEGVLFIGRGVNTAPSATPEDMVSLRAWLEPKRLITVVVRRLQSAEKVAAEIDRNGAEGTAEILVRVIAQMIDRMSPVVDQLNESAADIQQRVIDERETATTGELATVRLQSLALARYMAPLRDAVDELSRTSVEWLEGAQTERLGLEYERIARLVEDLAAIQARAAVARDELLSQQSEMLNRRVYSLSIIAALFLPLGFLTGLLGVNVGGMPGIESDTAFWIVCVGLAVVVSVQLVLLKKLRWF